MVARARTVVAGVVLLAVVGGGVLLARRHFAPRGPVVLENGKTHYGKTYAEWGTEWWKWILETPPSAGCGVPLEDPTGALCATGQPNDAFFLAGTNGGSVLRKECVVPSDRPIFFPVINGVEEFLGNRADDPRSEAQLAATVDDLVNSASSPFAFVDGASIDVTHFRVPTTRFSYTLPPEPNFYSCGGKHDLHGKVDTAYHAGYWILLAPLSPGPRGTFWRDASRRRRTARHLDHVSATGRVTTSSMNEGLLCHRERCAATQADRTTARAPGCAVAIPLTRGNGHRVVERSAAVTALRRRPSVPGAITCEYPFGDVTDHVLCAVWPCA